MLVYIVALAFALLTATSSYTLNQSLSPGLVANVACMIILPFTSDKLILTVCNALGEITYDAAG